MSSPLSGPPPSQTRFHPNFDREVFMVAFSVCGQGFKTDAARLCMHSEFMRTMLYGEDGKRGGDLGLPGEGTTDSPLVIDGCTPETFANFMSWLNHASWETPGITGTAGYLDVLHMTHMWQMKAGFDFAVKYLGEANIRAAHRIYLARRYGIPQWVPVAVRVLLIRSFEDYTEEDYNNLGFGLLIRIATGKESIYRVRQQLTFIPPYPSSDNAPHCSTPDKCKKAWYTAWGKDMVRRIHNPTSYFPLSDVLIAL